MSCTLTHYDLAKRRVYSAQVHFGSSAACLSAPLWVPQLGRPCISFASLRVVSRGSPALDEYGAHGFGPWLGDPVVPSQAQPCTSTTTAHTAPDRDSQGHRISLPTLVVQHLLPMASKEDLSAGWQLWAQDKALWLSVQPVPGTGGLVCCSQDEIY